VPAKLRVGEILEEYRSFYRDPGDVDELLDVLGLAAKRGDYYRSLSGGQRQRLSVALALIGHRQLHPLGAAVEAIQDSMQTGFPPARPLLVLVAYAVVFAVAARRFFRWELPARRPSGGRPGPGRHPGPGRLRVCQHPEH
jgi:hypothetical protein